MLPHLSNALHSSQTPVMVFICHFMSRRCLSNLITSPNLTFLSLDPVSDAYDMVKYAPKYLCSFITVHFILG